MFGIYDVLWILLPLAIYVGWWYAKRDMQKYQRFLYTLSLRYLLEDKASEDDKDLAELSELEEGDSAELFLILGALFRKRGEVDRAIAMHEHVIRSEYIDDEMRLKAQWALVDDYMVSGFLDRTEALLRTLLDTHYHNDALVKLAKVYEKQRDWLQAIAVLDRLPEQEKALHQFEMAHFYCELAEAEVDQKNALSWVTHALDHNEYSARAMLIRLNIEIKNKQFFTALEILHVLEVKQPLFVSMMVPIFYHVCYMQDDLATFEQFLDRHLSRQDPHINLLLWKTHFLVLSDGAEIAHQFLSSHLQKRPNLKGVLLLNQLELMTHDDSAQVYAHTFQKVIDHYSRFRCEECGFVTKILHWRCPSCNQWDTAAPSQDIIALKSAV